MLTDNNKFITSIVCVGQSLAFTLCNGLVSIMGQLVALLDKILLICTFIFNALLSLEHYIQSNQWV